MQVSILVGKLLCFTYIACYNLQWVKYRKLCGLSNPVISIDFGWPLQVAAGNLHCWGSVELAQCISPVSGIILCTISFCLPFLFVSNVSLLLWNSFCFSLKWYSSNVCFLSHCVNTDRLTGCVCFYCAVSLTCNGLLPTWKWRTTSSPTSQHRSKAAYNIWSSRSKKITWITWRRTVSMRNLTVGGRLYCS